MAPTVIVGAVWLRAIGVASVSVCLAIVPPRAPGSHANRFNRFLVTQRNVAASAGQARGFKTAVLGAAGGIGQVKDCIRLSAHVIVCAIPGKMCHSLSGAFLDRSISETAWGGARQQPPATTPPLFNPAR